MMARIKIATRIGEETEGNLLRLLQMTKRSGRILRTSPKADPPRDPVAPSQKLETKIKRRESVTISKRGNARNRRINAGSAMTILVTHLDANPELTRTEFANGMPKANAPMAKSARMGTVKMLLLRQPRTIRIAANHDQDPNPLAKMERIGSLKGRGVRAKSEVERRAETEVKARKGTDQDLRARVEAEALERARAKRMANRKRDGMTLCQW